jgi:hypothetical protein
MLRSLVESDVAKPWMRRKMELFRKLSVILQNPEMVSPDQEAAPLYGKQNIPKALADEFDTFGLLWLHTFAPCFPLDGNKVMRIFVLCILAISNWTGLTKLQYLVKFCVALSPFNKMWHVCYVIRVLKMK